MYMRPTVGGSSTVFDDLVELVGAISLKYASEAVENPLRIDRVFGVGIIVEDVGITSVSAVNPDVSFVCFAETFFDNRKSGGIRLQSAALQNELAHSFDNRTQDISNFFQPSTHGRAVDGNAQGFEHLFLAVKRQVQPEFVSCDFGKETRTRHSFINRLVRFLSSDDLSFAVVTGILEHDVLDAFEESADELDLVRDIEADHLSRLSAARAGNLAGVNAMFNLACCKTRRWSRATAAMLLVGHDVQSFFFSIELVGCLAMNCCSCAGQQGGIDFCGLLAKGCTVSSTELFFQFSDTFFERFELASEFSDHFVTFRNIAWKVIGIFCRTGFLHGVSQLWNRRLLYSMPPPAVAYCTD